MTYVRLHGDHIVMRVRGPNNVGRVLSYASVITEQKKCWELLAQKFDQFQTSRNNMQHPTMLGVVARQCCVRLHGP